MTKQQRWFTTVERMQKEHWRNDDAHLYLHFSALLTSNYLQHCGLSNAVTPVLWWNTILDKIVLGPQPNIFRFTAVNKLFIRTIILLFIVLGSQVENHGVGHGRDHINNIGYRNSHCYVQ